MTLALSAAVLCNEVLQSGMNSENVSTTTLNALQCLEKTTITEELLRETKLGLTLNTFAKRGPEVLMLMLRSQAKAILVQRKQQVCQKKDAVQARP